MSSSARTASDDGVGTNAVAGDPADPGPAVQGPAEGPVPQGPVPQGSVPQGSVPQESRNRRADRLRAAGQRFVVQLRRNEGLDPDALDELCEAIDSCGRDWAHSPAVPKSAALILAELFPAIESCAWLYPDPMRQRIIEAATRVAQSVSASLDNPDGGLDPDL